MIQENKTKELSKIRKSIRYTKIKFNEEIELLTQTD